MKSLQNNNLHNYLFQKRRILNKTKKVTAKLCSDFLKQTNKIIKSVTLILYHARIGVHFHFRNWPNQTKN